MNSLYESIKDRIKFIQFPKLKIDPHSKTVPKLSDSLFYYIDYHNDVKNVLRLPMGDTYYGWVCNHHHFTTKYHISTVIPTLNDLFSFGFQLNDFNFISRDVNGFDISMPVPKKEMLFDVISYSDNEQINNIKYTDFLYCGNGKFLQETEYHKIYKYRHRSSKIINKSTPSNRKLLISGDSQMIPSVPILSTYFKEVLFFDKRDNIYHFNEDITNITDILFAIGYNDFTKYINNIT